ncbi:MAG: tetratricopeptide repeat protein [Armatimonadetes bacterium]|nr:tetratricopeptide repeat protein [Armatimonadota bacterium]
MRALVIAIIVLTAAAVGASAADLSDAAGVVRLFGDTSSWTSSCFVVGDGSWVITTSDSISEVIGPETIQTIRYPLFISAFTGRAYECELKAINKELNVAILKLPVTGLPAAPLAKGTDFSKAVSGTLGQLSSGEVVGGPWATKIFGITLDKSRKQPKLGIEQWSAKKAFVTEIGRYKWLFVNGVSPALPVPNGSMVAYNDIVAGMYISKLVVTGGSEDIIYGRCAMAPEIARYCGDSGIDSSTLYEPPKPTAAKFAQAGDAFQLQAQIYTAIGAQRPALALNAATALVALLPKDAKAQISLAVAQLGADKAEEALKTFDKARELDPDLPNLRCNRAQALAALKKTEEAEKELLEAEKGSPQDPRPVVALASFYLGDEKTLDKALSYAKKATILTPNSAAAELLIGKVEKSRKNYAASIKAIGEAVKMAPEWGEAWYALGATYEEAGDKANAEKAYRKLAEKQPKNPDPLITLASFLIDIEKKTEAAEVLTKIRALNPPKEVLEAVQKLQDKIDGKAEEEQDSK